MTKQPAKRKPRTKTAAARRQAKPPGVLAAERKGKKWWYYGARLKPGAPGTDDETGAPASELARRFYGHTGPTLDTDADGVFMPPAYLSPEACALWRDIVRTYEWDEPLIALVTLRTALEQFDRMRAAQLELIDNEGRLTVYDRKGQLKPHPAAVIERAAQKLMFSILAKLGIELEPKHGGPGRPAGSKNKPKAGKLDPFGANN